MSNKLSRKFDQLDLETKEELKELIHLGRKYKWSHGEVRHFLETNGINLARSDFYSEIPCLQEIENSFEYLLSTNVHDTQPIFDNSDIFPEERLKAFAQSLVPLCYEFDTTRLEEMGLFSWTSGQLTGNDAMALYAMIRRFKPKKIVEIGSGQSTFVSSTALGSVGSGNLYCIDPQPRQDITSLANVKFYKCRVQDISPAELVDALGEGDIIFYDGEHSLKTGNSAVYFYQLILPYLRPGVIVHIHDVRLPYPRNIAALLQARLYWTEPYIVMAFLHDLNRYKVLFGSEFTKRRFPNIAKEMMHGRAEAGGVSLWMEILDDSRKAKPPHIPTSNQMINLEIK